MATQKHARLINLYIALLYTNTYLTAEKIRESVDGYQDGTTAEAFKRMFERDKADLRDMGIPIEVDKSMWDTAEGYKIRRRQAELAPITLTSEEAAAVNVASQLWGSRELSDAVQGAVLKLRASGVEISDDVPTIVSPLPARNTGSEKVIGLLKAAVESGQTVTFEHRTAGGATVTTRTVDPWGLVSHDGRWYFVGHDHARNDVRTFRVSRMGDDVRTIGAAEVLVPAGTDVRQIVRDAVMGETVGTARVWVADGRGRDIRLIGTVTESRELAGRSGDVIDLELRGSDWLARLLAGLGPDAVVLEPETLRAEVIARLRGVAGASEAAGNVAGVTQ